MSFAQRLLPAKKNSGFQMADYWTWCGSPIRAVNPGEDGRFHMFASRWPKNMSFGGHWPTNSEIVRASSDTAEGPYRFESVVLPMRGPGYFDGMATHNPLVRYYKGRYYLYYVGVTYDFDVPTADNPIDPPTADNPIGDPKAEKWRQAWEHKRLGLAVADSVKGPWKRVSKPLLEPRPGKWDSMITSNPSVAIREDGRTLLVYKSRDSWKAPFHLAFAQAPTPEGPFKRLTDGPGIDFDCEDPSLWWEDGRYHLITKDFHGTIGGESYGGVYLTSKDALKWKLGEPPLAYSCTMRWTDGTSSKLAQVERATVLLDKGKSTHVCFAIIEGTKRYAPVKKTRNIVVPLRPLKDGGKTKAAPKRKR